MSADFEAASGVPSADRLLDASTAVGALSRALEELTGYEPKAPEAALSLAIAQCHLVELAAHLNAGKDLRDALLATARGELRIG